MLSLLLAAASHWNIRDRSPSKGGVGLKVNISEVHGCVFTRKIDPMWRIYVKVTLSVYGGRTESVTVGRG